MNDEQVKIVRGFLKEKIKENLSDIEKDIFDTADEILKEPFDYNSASVRVNFNYVKYEIVKWVKDIQPQAQWKTQLTPQEVKDNLRIQLAYLYNKYLEQNNG